jgi:hypothetical protein
MPADPGIRFMDGILASGEGVPGKGIAPLPLGPGRGREGVRRGRRPGIHPPLARLKGNKAMDNA